MNEPREAAVPAGRRGGPAAVPPVLTLRADDGATAEVHRHGAHVTSWRPMGEADDRLYLSARSEFSGAAAIRGGVPVIFPQFAAEGPLPKHGFARTTTWTLRDNRHDADGSAVHRAQDDAIKPAHRRRSSELELALLHLLEEVLRVG